MSWRDRVAAAIHATKRTAGGPAPQPHPPFDPLTGELETWRCGRVGKNGIGTSYCRAQCPKNAAYTNGDIPA